MDLKPLSNRIIVRRESSDDKTTGGIILPETAKKKPQRGTVLAVGPGKLNTKDGTRMSMTLKVGDKVLFTAWAGDEFKENKKAGEILVMHEDDVMAVVG